MAVLNLQELNDKIKGDLLTDDLHKIIYATDASVYRELPLGVVLPKDTKDICVILKWCFKNNVPLIPRAGGTSLAGQCVGSGLVIDVSKYLTKIISFDKNNKSVTVQPGVIRNDLNQFLKPYNLLFGPNTATANRANIGGMVGNNSCGTTSIVYGNTRDHVVRLKAVLSDGSLAVFEPLSKVDFLKKCQLTNLEGDIYRHLLTTLSDIDFIAEIHKEYPNKFVKRRNTGYALDMLIENEVFSNSDDKINICSLLCGSEGTLAFTTEITIDLVDVPPPYEVLVAIHYHSIDESLRSIPLIMNHKPYACEMMDKIILDCTKGQITYQKNRFFIEDDPQVIMLVSFRTNNLWEGKKIIIQLIDELKSNNFGYAFPIIETDVDRIWNLRGAGLGLLANLPGDNKAVACIEDTAVNIEVLADYIAEFSLLMDSFGQQSVYYAHAGAGEIHLRPILNLKTKEDKALFYDISLASAQLVKKYGGSLSGEHGDGRVRAPFIKVVYGEYIYESFVKLKNAWDPKNILNPGKIVNAPPMNESLRYSDDHEELSCSTMFDFSDTGGILRTAEKCNGSGDCRKSHLSGGTMCPSYMATRNEKDSTRARANTLREILTRPQSDNVWNSSELKDVMDLCLSCKGCKSECPSNIDMSLMKSEFLYQYNKHNGVPLRSHIIARFSKISKLSSIVAPFSNFIIKNKYLGKVLKKSIGIHPLRSLPNVDSRPLRSRWKNIRSDFKVKNDAKKVYFFCDEFTNFNDAAIGEKAIRLLFRLGYNVILLNHKESGRAAISKGLLDIAKEFADYNVLLFSKHINAQSPLVGIEPSAILSFCDEYPRLVTKHLINDSEKIAKNTFTIESFLFNEFSNGNLKEDAFNESDQNIYLHGHCHQKALTNIDELAWLLSLPKGNNVSIIPSGCCGMAGSFGYEKEHFDLSMQIGELILFPWINKLKALDIVAASGTSCRHQILDGTKSMSYHPIEILFDCLSNEV
ncbi:MAG: FAD-binding and (Fe-S)-binding domain-containing protein [Saprospiraceae bacterium]